MRLKQIFTLITAVALVAGCRSAEKELVEQTHPDGSKKKVSYYVGTRKNIVKTFFYFADGRVQSEQYFKKGLPDSVLIGYYAGGNKYKETQFSLGKRNGADRSWFENGQIKSEAQYVNDLLEGKALSYFENGKIWTEATYRNGKKEGEDIEYFPGGDKKKSLKTYVGGDATGIEKEWYATGTLKMEQMWEKNILNGHYATYYPDGKKEEEGSYKDGAYDGKRFMYNKQGRRISEGIYEKGALVGGQSL
jgi:uncharacterized protein